MSEPSEVSQECFKDCQAGPGALAVIETFEGYSPVVYKDSAGLPTIGIGHLIKPGEKIPQPLLPHQAKELLKKDTKVAVAGVNRRVKVPLKQHQADALISFTFNVGEGSLSKSTLLKKVNSGKHHEVPNEFLRWVYAGGKYIRGLFLRRQAESMLYNGVDS